MLRKSYFYKEIRFFQGDFPERMTKAVLGFGSTDYLIEKSDAVNQISVVNEYNRDSLSAILSEPSIKYSIYARATGLMAFEIGVRLGEGAKINPSYTIPITENDRAILDTGEIIVPRTTKFLVPIREYQVKTRKSFQYRALKEFFWGEEEYTIDEMIGDLRKRWVDLSVRSKVDKRSMTVRIREDEFGRSQLRISVGDLTHIYCLFLARMLFEIYPYLDTEIESAIANKEKNHGDIQVVGGRWRKVYWRYQSGSEEMYSDPLFTITPNGFVDEKEISIPMDAIPSLMEWLIFEHELYRLDRSLYPVRIVAPIIDVEANDSPEETHRRVQENMALLLGMENEEE